MSRNSGSKLVGPCRYCGKRYMLTNWMRKRRSERDENGFLLSDTHLIACHRKKPTPPEREEVP